MATLTESKIRAAKAQEKPYKLFAERGLFMLVTPSGGRLWRFKYRYASREKLLSLGRYPDVSLRRAREKREEARKLVADGIDPSAKRQAEKGTDSDTFAALAAEWLCTKEKSLAPGTWQRDKDQLTKFVIPYLGSKPIASITAPDLLDALRRIEARGRHDTAHRTRAVCGRVFRYAIATGRAKHDVSADLRGALAPKATRNYAAITNPIRLGKLLRDIHGYDGQPATQAALRLAAYLFVRPGELRAAEWAEFDLDAALWRLPGSRMKMGEQHTVPLASQTVAILREIHPMTGEGRYVFPSLLTRERPMSENTLNTALRRLGYTNSEMVAHGFRSTASTLLNEQGWNPDVIELQLAHAERNKVRGAYNKAQRLEERTKMMQAWADYLDGLRSGGNVVPIKRSA